MLLSCSFVWHMILQFLYGVPLDLDDPEDLWKLIRIAFAIQVGEDAGNAVLKGVPAVVRPVVKAIFFRSQTRRSQKAFRLSASIYCSAISSKFQFRW